MKAKGHIRKKLAVEERDLDHESNIPDWQLMAMLHYEYARCSKLMLKAVSVIRNPDRLRNTKGFDLPFANYLARQFPEFPKTPWEKIAKDTRKERLASIGINEQNGLYSSPLPAWKSWEFFDADALALNEELSDFAAESYGIFKIDFGQVDLLIKQQFSEWLDHRRTFLLDRYDSNGKLAAGITQNANRYFRGRPPRKRVKGGGAPPKKYRSALTALGKLRAFTHAHRDVDLVNQMGEIKDLSSWLKYENYAARMMMCVQSAWKCRAGIVDVFDGKNLKSNVGFGGFIYPPKSLDESRKGKVKLVRKFLALDFTIAKLRKD